jgi:hypothetical protein
MFGFAQGSRVTRVGGADVRSKRQVAAALMAPDCATAATVEFVLAPPQGAAQALQLAAAEKLLGQGAYSAAIDMLDIAVLATPGDSALRKEFFV